jgi:hypothetical protein
LVKIPDVQIYQKIGLLTSPLDVVEDGDREEEDKEVMAEDITEIEGAEMAAEELAAAPVFSSSYLLWL